MRVIVILATLLCVVCSSASYADARPRHHHGATSANFAQVGCSDPVMRPCGGEGAQSRNLNRMLRVERRPMPPGLRRVMAEGAGRVVNWTKPRAWCGWWMRKHLGVANPAGNLARWWAGFGRPAHGPRMSGLSSSGDTMSARSRDAPLMVAGSLNRGMMGIA
jgi:hypothetical protein